MVQNCDRRSHARPAPLSDTLGAVRVDLDARFPKSGEPAELPPKPSLPAQPAALVEVRADLDAMLADHARALHARRALVAAVDHGVALFAALGLPQLVGPDHIAIDPEAAGTALDEAIAALDALDGDPDLEPWLAGDQTPGLPMDAEEEPEHDEDDGTREPSLASPERHPSAPSYISHRHTTRAREDSQTRWAEGAQHDGELVDEDADDLDRGEHDDADDEPWLGSLEHVDQTAWAESDGTGRELAEDGGLSARLSIEDSHANAAAAREAGQQARALASRIKTAQPARDPDTVSFVGMRPGTGLWRPHIHNGVLVMGFVS